MGTAADFLIGELRSARVLRGMNQDDFGKMINYSGSHVSAVETGQRPPKPEYVAAVDEALHTGGIYGRMLDKLASLDSAPPWLREWIEIEREATTLRWFESAYIPGLLQTEAYARATLAGGRFTPCEIDRRITSRLERQAILMREQPPQFVAVFDEAVIRRPVRGQPELMREQVDRLVESAEAPHIQVHVVPADAGMYLGLAGAFIIAELSDGGRVAHTDSQLNAQIIDQPADVARLAKTWEAVRNEALPRHQSLELIKDVAKTWT